MFGPNWKPLLIGAVVAVTLATGVSQADACWGCGWSYPGCCGYTTYYTPSYTSCCTVSYDPCCSTSSGWYVGYRPGPIRRLLFGRYRWYYGYWGSYSSCCWDPCCTEGATVAPTAPSQPMPTEAQKPAVPDEPVQPAVPPPTTSEPEPAVEPPAGAAPSTLHTQQNSALLTIYVPAGTKVFINGQETKSVGSRRQYVSYGLKPGFEYKYEIRAEVLSGRTHTTAVDRDTGVHVGPKVVERKRIPLTRTVVLTAGDDQKLAFTSGVATTYAEVYDPVTLGVGVERKVYVLDDILKQTQRRFEVEGRPIDWVSPPPIGL